MQPKHISRPLWSLERVKEVIKEIKNIISPLFFFSSVKIKSLKTENYDMGFGQLS